MKLLIAGFLWVLCILSGVRCSARISKRAVFFEKLVLLTDAIEREIGCFCVEVPRIIEELCKNEMFRELSFLEICSEKLSLNEDFPGAWKTGVENGTHFLSQNEKSKLLSLGSSLGTSDRDSQLKLLMQYRGMFESFLASEKEKRNRYSRAVLGVSFFAGCVLFILFI